MESWSVSHKALQLFCAGFWETADDCQLILDEIGISGSRINLSEPSIMRWLSIIRELMRKNDGSMGRLVTVLIKQYPDNQQLRTVCAPWIPANPAMPVQSMQPEQPDDVPAGAVLVKKFVNDHPPVPVVAPPDFADEAGLIVPRVDTLWEAMVETNRRLNELERRWAELYQWKDSLFGQHVPQQDKP